MKEQIYIISEICGWFCRVISIWGFITAISMYNAECFDQATFFISVACLGEVGAWGTWIHNEITNGKDK